MRSKSGEQTAGKRNVCYVVPEHHPDSVQHFAHVPNLLRALAERVRVAALVERGEAVDLPGVDPVVVLSDRPSWNPLRFVEYVNAARRMRAAGFDTYFIRYSRAATTVLLLTRPFLKHRIVFWSSGQADMRDPDGAPRFSLTRAIKHGWSRWMLRSVDQVVTGPESMVDYMQRRWRLKAGHVALLYNDIDVDRFSPVAAVDRSALRERFGWGDQFVVLCVHRLAYRRGSRLLVPVLEKLVASGAEDARLVVVGDGPDAERLAHDASECGRGSAIEVLGAVPNRELPDLYRAADCFLMPSYEEGFPRVLLEAMATELPVVTTPAGGSADIVGSDYCYLVPIGDIDAMVATLSELREQTPDARAELGRGLRQRVVERYGTDSVAEMLARLLP